MDEYTRDQYIRYQILKQHIEKIFKVKGVFKIQPLHGSRFVFREEFHGHDYFVMEDRDFDYHLLYATAQGQKKAKLEAKKLKAYCHYYEHDNGKTYYVINATGYTRVVNQDRDNRRKKS